jgi:hypothetical protein
MGRPPGSRRERRNSIPLIRAFRSGLANENPNTNPHGGERIDADFNPVPGLKSVWIRQNPRSTASGIASADSAPARDFRGARGWGLGARQVPANRVEAELRDPSPDYENDYEHDYDRRLRSVAGHPSITSTNWME